MPIWYAYRSSWRVIFNTRIGMNQHESAAFWHRHFLCRTLWQPVTALNRPVSKLNTLQGLAAALQAKNILELIPNPFICWTSVKTIQQWLSLNMYHHNSSQVETNELWNGVKVCEMKIRRGNPRRKKETCDWTFATCRIAGVFFRLQAGDWTGPRL